MNGGIMRKILFLLLLITAASLVVYNQDKDTKTNDIILQAMQTELNRSTSQLKMENQPSPYFISYWIQKLRQVTVSTKNGAIINSLDDTFYNGDVDMRVGSYEFDNTNLPAGEEMFSTLLGYAEKDIWYFPVEKNLLAVRTSLWYLSDMKYKLALESYFKKKAEQVYSLKEKINDFSKEKPGVYIENDETMTLNIEALSTMLKHVSLWIGKNKDIYQPYASFTANHMINYMINTEGTTIKENGTYFQISLSAKAWSTDGFTLRNFRSYYVRTVKELPDEQKLMKDADAMILELKQLREAKALTPYTGPAILTPDVTGVFFHEALGHRLEGERQRDEESGQTFKGKIGEKILPEFISVYDDPTMQSFQNQSLVGFYHYDNEGVPAQRVLLVEKGVLRNYLMSRTPLKEFPNSNGHGRSETPGMWNLSMGHGRMATLIVKAEKELSMEQLKKMLLEEVKKQNKPFGLIITHSRGGDTTTGASSEGSSQYQAFREAPILVYTVDAKTGKETLVRNVEIVGTPLISIERILAASNNYEVFNGTCSAESGSVPVSIIAPAVLTAQVELQKTGTKPYKPPLLPSPLW
jgi:TldD protein